MENVSIIPFGGKTPVIHPDAFIAPGCRIIGDVEIGAGASIWYNCVIRGDVNFVRIGARTNVQDGSVIHCDSGMDGGGGFPTILGEDVLIGHMAMIHGTIVHDRGFVGLGTITMDGCVIGSDAMLAAGAMLTPGKHIPSGQLWGGRPAKYMRDLSEAAMLGMRLGVAHYVHNAQNHKNAISGA
jgi:gamma-carbonic anhydrase